MVPHLVRAWSAYKDMDAHTHTHTHTTDTCITGDGLIE